MLEDIEDGQPGYDSDVALAAWERLCFSLRIFDAWHVDAFRGILSFSRSNRRVGGSNLSH